MESPLKFTTTEFHQEARCPNPSLRDLPQRAHEPLKTAACPCPFLFPANYLWKKEKKESSLWTHSFLSQIILFNNEFLIRPTPTHWTHWNICQASPILHKRGLKTASSYCEGRTCERPCWGVSHPWLEVHHASLLADLGCAMHHIVHVKKSNCFPPWAPLPCSEWLWSAAPGP